MKRALKLAICLFLFSILAVLFHVSSVSAMPSGYSGVTANTPINNGFEMKIQTIYEGNPSDSMLYFWSAETLSNNVWVQFGWSCAGGVIYPFIGVAGVEHTKISYNGNPITDTFSGWTGPATFVNGTTHDFKTIFSSDSTMSFYIDDVLVYVLTPTIVNQVFAKNNLNDNVPSFSTTGTGNDVEMVAETYQGKVDTLIDAPIAIAVLINGVWTIPSQATLATHYLDDGIGFAGQLQFSNLKFGEIVFGIMVSDYGSAVAWNGHAQPVGQESSPTSTPNLCSNLKNGLSNVPIVPLLAMVVSGVVFAFTVGYAVTHRKGKRRRK